jgi:TP901 family phage tail tape measure protein
MANAFGMSAEAAGQSSAVIMNSFALPMARLHEVADAINVLGNSMATTERDIIEVMTRIGGASQQFGLTAEQAAALSASLLSLGKSPMVVGTSINALLSRLQTANVQGDEFRVMLERMGVSAEQLAADIRENPQQALLTFLQTLSRLDKQSQAEALVKLFGQEYQDDIASLLSTLGQYEAALGRVSDKEAVAGSLEAEYQKRLKTTQAQLDIMKQNFENLAITLGNTLLPLIKSLAGIFGDAAKAINVITDTFPGLTLMAEILAAAAVSAGGLRLALAAMGVVGAKVIGAMMTDLRMMNQGIGAAVGQVGKLKAAYGVMAAALIGWEIGTHLREEFLIVEQAGIALAAGFTRLMERAKAAWEIMKHPGNISAILDEMRANLKAIDDEYAELFAAAEKARQQKNAPKTKDAPKAAPKDAPKTTLAPDPKVPRGGGGGAKRDPVAEANLSKMRDLTRQLVEVEQQRAKAEAGIFESTTKARDALEIWLATDENALKLSAQETAARRAQADAVDTVTASLKNLNDANKRQKDIAAAMPAITLELAKMRGEDTAAREIAAKYKEIRDKLQAELDSGSLTAQADLDIVVKLQGLEEQKAKLDGVLATVEKIRALQSQEEQSIQTGREIGTLTEVEAQEKLLNLHQKIGAELLKQKPLLETLAKAPGIVGEQARAALAQLDDQMNRLKATTTLFEMTVKNGLTSGLQSAIQGLADGTMTLREAIHELASTVAQSLLKMYADNAVQYFIREGGPLSGFFAAANKGADGAGGFLGALFGNGVQQPAEGGALTAASGQLSTASGQFQAAVTQFQSAIASLTGSATTLTGSATTLTSAGATQTTAAGMQTTAAGLQTTAAGMETTAASLQSTAGGSLSAAATQQMAAAGALQGAAATGAASGGGGGGIGGLFSGIMSLFGFAEGGALPGHSVSNTSDNTLYWGTPGEFVTRRKIVRQPGTRAFLEALNRYGLASAARFAKFHALPGFADGGYIPAPPVVASPMRQIAANFSPAAAGGSTSVDNRIALNLIDDPERIASVLRTAAGEKAMTIMLSRNPKKFRQILGLG